MRKEMLRACAAALFALLTLSGMSAGRELHVLADASQCGDGSRGKPFQTLEQARDAIRAARAEGSIAAGPITVLIGPGTYNLQRTFKLEAADGGTAAAPVTYRAAKPGRARLHGGVTIDPTTFKPVADPAILARLDESVRGKVLVCDLSSLAPAAFEPFKTAYRGPPAAPWLYIDRQPQILARWPNADAPAGGWAGFTKAVDSGKAQSDSPDPALRKARPGSFVFDDPRPSRWNLEDGVWLLGYWTHDWFDEAIRVAAYDRDKGVITLAAPHQYGIAGGTWGAKSRRFIALNALEELDAPGEWWLDRQRRLLYLYPATPLKGASIVLATMTGPLVHLKDTHHVRFSDLAFEFGHGEGIRLDNTKGVEIAGCVIANLARGGVTVSGYTNTVRSCDLYNLGTLGIQLNGGDRKLLKNGGNLAENNHIHHFGLFQRTYAPGIGVQGCGQIVRRNRIHDAPHNAILYGGNEHLFEGNQIYRVVLETGDAGAFYTGRDWTSQGNILRHNFIHDLGGGDAGHVNTMGVYLDDCDCGDTLDGNIFLRAGRAIMIGGGRDNPIINNLVVDCPIGLHIDSRGMTWKHWNNTNDPSWCLDAKAQALNYKEPPWSERYPNLARIMEDAPREPLYNPVRDNLFIDCTRKFCDFDGNVMKLLDKLELSNNLAVNSTGSTNVVAVPATIKGFRNLVGSEESPVKLGFTNPAAGDFSLQRKARLTQEMPAFKPPPVDKIGLYKDQYRRRLPAP